MSASQRASQRWGCCMTVHSGKPDTTPHLIAAIKARLEADFEALVHQWFPLGQQKGREWIALNPSRPDDHAGSFSISLDKKFGRDFSADKNYDAIDLYAMSHGLDNRTAIKQLKAQYNIVVDETAPVATTPKLVAIEPPVIKAPPFSITAPNFAHYQDGLPDHIYPYKDILGNIIGYVCRWDTKEGIRDRKTFRPMTWATRDGKGKARGQQITAWGWDYAGWGTSRPLFGAEQLRDKPDAYMLLVEGEKTALAAQKLSHRHVVLGFAGTSTPKHIQWPESIFSIDRPVLIMPDNDVPGRKAAEEIASILRARNVTVAIVQPPEGKCKGWDLSDALDEGWTAEDFAAFLLKANFGDYVEKAPKAKTGKAEKQERAAPTERNDKNKEPLSDIFARVIPEIVRSHPYETPTKLIQIIHERCIDDLRISPQRISTMLSRHLDKVKDEKFAQLKENIAYDGHSTPQDAIDYLLPMVGPCLRHSATAVLAVKVLVNHIWQIKRKIADLKVPWQMCFVLMSHEKGRGKSDFLRNLHKPLFNFGSLFADGNLFAKSILDERNACAIFSKYAGILDDMTGFSEKDCGDIRALLSGETVSYRELFTHNMVTMQNKITFCGSANCASFDEIYPDTELERRFYGILVDTFIGKFPEFWDSTPLWRLVDENWDFFMDRAELRVEQAKQTRKTSPVEWVESFDIQFWDEDDYKENEAIPVTIGKLWQWFLGSSRLGQTEKDKYRTSESFRAALAKMPEFKSSVYRKRAPTQYEATLKDRSVAYISADFSALEAAIGTRLQA